MWLVKEPPPPSQFPCLPLTVCFCLKILCVKYISSVEKRMCGLYSSNQLCYHSSPFVFYTMMGNTLLDQDCVPFSSHCPLSLEWKALSNLVTSGERLRFLLLLLLTLPPLRDNIKLGTTWWFGVFFSGFIEKLVSRFLKQLLLCFVWH